MKYLLLTGDETRHDLETAMQGLRHRQQRAKIPKVRDELDADINELIDRWHTAPSHMEPA